MKKSIVFILCLLLSIGFSLNLTSCSTAESVSLTVSINGKAITLSGEDSIDLDLLSVENGITVTTDSEQEVSVNGQVVNDSVHLDITSIARSDTLEFVTDDGQFTVNLMPSDLRDFTTEGESLTDGDYYMATYDEANNYIFKLNSQGKLIFYKETGENALDFRKETNSNGEIRYTYMPYMESAFCGIEGINPGCVVVMDEDYNIIDELYYTLQNGEQEKIDPHGFIYLDDGHYILTAYKDEMVDDIPKELNATENKAYLAVLYMQEIKDGEVLWEFCSRDYEDFLYATTEVTWEKSKEACYDYMHFNSMYIDDDGNLLVSCRNINSILKLSRSTGELIWTLGGENDEFGLTQEQLFSKQHSIIVTSDGSYMIFNNANDEVAAGQVTSSSIIRFKVDENTKTITEYTEYETGFYSNYMGAIRELTEDVYLWSVGGNYTGLVPEYSMIEYSEKTGKSFAFRYNDGSGKLYCANKCK